MDEIEVITKDKGISVEKENGTLVDYFIFDEYEIHFNKIKPHTEQEWHKHNKIEEVIVVTKGEILVKYLVGNEEKVEKVSKGALVRVKKSVHTIENITDGIGEFIVYRMVPEGKNKREIIKNDKVLINEGQV